MPASSRPDEPAERLDLAVVALSGRALARSARRAGLRALCVDLFADRDAQEHAALAVRAPSRRGALAFARSGLLETLSAHAPEGLPVVLGAGFEHAPATMRAIARRNPILGAAAETVARLKDPWAFACLLDRLGVSRPSIKSPGGVAALDLSPAGRGRRAAPGEGASTYPERADPPHPPSLRDVDLSPPGRGGPPRSSPNAIALPSHPLPLARRRPLPAGERWAEAAAPSARTDGGVWLSKRAGAAGGGHVRIGAVSGARRYLQRFVDGRTISALFLANGADAQILGFSEQWPDPVRDAPFRYGGAVGPVPLAGGLETAVADALSRIVAATGLTGLASADMILPEGGGFVLLEINPRPGATLDVFDRAPWPSLLRLHLDACEGRLPGALPPLRGALAAAILHAPRAVRPGQVERPHWTADWPSCDETVPAGAPFCTVFAAGRDHAAARRLVDERRSALIAALASARVPAPTNPW